MYSRSSFKTINKITYVKPKKYAGKVPKSINIYFILNLCIFGFDFGYKKTLNKNFRLALSCIQLCVSIIMCVILNWRITLRTFDYYTALAFTIQYLAHNALLLLSKYNIYDLIVDVHSIDENIMEAVNTKLAIVLYLSTILNIGVKQTICVVNCLVDSAYYCETSFPGYWYCIPILGLDGITIIQMLLCYYVYRSVKYIRISLVNFDTKIVQERYHAVATYCDKIRPLNSAFVVVELLASAPKIMGTLWLAITLIETEGTSFTFWATIVFLSVILIQICGPAIMMQMIYSELDAIKVELHNQLMADRDGERSEERRRLLEFLQVRCCLQYDIWNIIPLDLRLPVSLIGICATYFIVLMQFSHNM